MITSLGEQGHEPFLIGHLVVVLPLCPFLVQTRISTSRYDFSLLIVVAERPQTRLLLLQRNWSIGHFCGCLQKDIGGVLHCICVGHSRGRCSSRLPSRAARRRESESLMKWGRDVVRREIGAVGVYVLCSSWRQTPSWTKEINQGLDGGLCFQNLLHLCSIFPN